MLSRTIEKLDKYSQLATRFILERLPEWEAHAVVSQPEGYDLPFIDFSFPCPSQYVEQGLWVSTFDREITVGFHTHHTHFTDYDNDEFDPAHVNDALQYVSDLLSERIAVISWYVGDRFTGSSSTETSSVEQLTPSGDGDTHMTRRSWFGTYDLDIQNT